MIILGNSDKNLKFPVIEELGAKTALVTIFSDFLKYWEILGYFHSCTVFYANGT